MFLFRGHAPRIMAEEELRPGAATELQLCAGNELRFVKFLELRKAAANFPCAARPKFDF